MAAEKGNRATVHTFPVNVLGTVTIFAYVTTDAHLLDKAGSADQIFSPRGVLHLKLLFAIYKPPKVRFDALTALIEANFLLDETHQVAIEVVAFCRQSLILVESLTARNFHCFNLQV